MFCREIIGSGREYEYAGLADVACLLTDTRPQPVSFRAIATLSKVCVTFAEAHSKRYLDETSGVEVTLAAGSSAARFQLAPLLDPGFAQAAGSDVKHATRRRCGMRRMLYYSTHRARNGLLMDGLIPQGHGAAPRWTTRARLAGYRPESLVSGSSTKMLLKAISGTASVETVTSSVRCETLYCINSSWPASVTCSSQQSRRHQL